MGKLKGQPSEGASPNVKPSDEMEPSDKTEDSGKMKPSENAVPSNKTGPNDRKVTTVQPEQVTLPDPFASCGLLDDFENAEMAVLGIPCDPETEEQKKKKKKATS